MEPVEMVPADTTSDHTPSLSHLTHSHNTEPPTKRPKLDLINPPPKQRPIGIAQPFRQLPLEVLKVPRLQGVKNTPECSDSEESQDDNRFDRFANESDSGRVVEEISTPHKTSVQDATGLPGGRKWMVFVSHSTSDHLWVRGNIVVPLRELKIPVAASYHFMPDASRYDDKAIHGAMADSCMVLIALSPGYLNSGRCTNESVTAVRLRPSLEVVVAAMRCCNRPDTLKHFLYLDFIDPTKRDTVWDKLMETIDYCMTTPRGSKEGEDVQHRVTSHTHDRHTHTDHTHPPHSVTYSTLSEDQHVRMVNDFELMYEEKQLEQSIEGTSSLGDHMTGASSLEDHMTEASSLEDHMTGASSLEDHMTGASSLEDRMTGASSLEDHMTGASSLEDHMTGMSSLGDHMTQSHSSEGTSDHVADETRHAADEEVTNDSSVHSTGDDTITAEVKGRLEDVEEGEVADSADETTLRQNDDDQATKVTSFYNQLARPDVDRRQESPIFFMRNFNNWVKSVLIRGYVQRGAIVLDLCCGKGGDLLKWKEGRIGYLICADISDVSVEAAKSRYTSNKMMMRGRPPFEAEFICADCCQVRLRERYMNPGRRFNITSCQFSIHYSFESFDKAHMMFRNACENLIPGGYLVGTTIDANRIVYRLKEAGQSEDGLWKFGNEIFTVTLDPSLDPRDTLPLFGSKYNFKLHGVVDLPEYLVHFPTFQSMLEEYDMEFVHRQSFIDFFHERRHRHDDADLLFKMSAFDKQTGTMSAAEWEAIGLYMVFVFRKRFPA